MAVAGRGGHSAHVRAHWRAMTPHYDPHYAQRGHNEGSHLIMTPVMTPVHNDPPHYDPVMRGYNVSVTDTLRQLLIKSY